MAVIKKAGKDKIQLMGRNYESTLRVDPQTRAVIEGLAPSIAYNGSCDRWDVYTSHPKKGRSHTTLQRAVASTFTKRLDGNVVFANGDNTDFRKSNLQVAV